MKQRNRGFTLIEIIGVIALGSILLIGLSSMIDTALDDNKAQQAAFYQAQVADAVLKYMAGTTDLPSKTATGPYVVTLAELKSTGYLPTSFANANVYGQTPCTVIRRRDPAVETKLDALVVAAGANKIPDKDIPSAAANSGPGGGYIKLETPTTLIAQGSSWNLGTTELTKFVAPGCLAGDGTDAGHLASALFYDAGGQLADEFLYRKKVSGRLDLNKMTTPLFLPGTATAQTSQPGVCDATSETWGSLTTDSQGEVLSCVNGIWEKQEGRHWKTPVANVGELSDPSKVNPAFNQIGDMRMEMEKKQIYMWRGTKWMSIALDDNGRLAANDILIQRQEKAGTACKPEDLVGTVAIEKGTGMVLSCQSNVWMTQSSLRSRADLAKSATWVILKSDQPVSDLPSAYTIHPGNFDPASNFGYDPSSAWSSAAFSTDPIQPGKDGLLVVQTYSTMDRQRDFEKPLEFPNPTVGGQFEIQAWVEDLDTGKRVGTPTISRSGKLRNEAVTINAALVQAIPKNNAGYVVKFLVRWTTFEASNIYKESWWGDSSGNHVYQTPLTATYNIDVST